MKLFINRSALLAVQANVMPAQMSPDLIALISSNNIRGTVDVPDVAAAYATWPNPFVVSSLLEPLTAGIKIWDAATGTLVPVTLRSANLSLGVTCNTGGNAFNFTNALFQAYPDPNTVTPVAPVNNYNALRYRRGVYGSSLSGYPEIVLTSKDGITTPSANSITTRGVNPDYQYFQSTSILPLNPNLFANQLFIDSITTLAGTTYEATISLLNAAIVQHAFRAATADTFELIFDSKFDVNAPSAQTDMYLIIPMPASRHVQFRSSDIATNTNSVSSAEAGFVPIVAPFQSCGTQIIIPLRALAGVASVEQTVSEAQYFASQTVQYAGNYDGATVTIAEIAGTGKIGVSFEQPPLGQLLNPNNITLPIQGFI